MRYQTRAVLAGAYLKGHRASLLTHSVDTENGDAPLCKRVKADSIADEHADDVNAPPTCLVCRARDPRFSAPTKRKSFDVEARERLDSFDGVVPAEFAVRSTFRAKLHAALPLGRIVAIASALEDRTFTVEDIRNALSRMVRAGVLRRRMTGGESHWEINVGGA